MIAALRAMTSAPYDDCDRDSGAFLKTPEDIYAFLAGIVVTMLVAVATYLYFHWEDILDRISDYSFDKADINKNGAIDEAELLAAVTSVYLEVNLITTFLAIRVKPPCVAYVHEMLMEHGKPLDKPAFRRAIVILFMQGLKRASAQVAFYALSPIIAGFMIDVAQFCYVFLDLPFIDVAKVGRWLFDPCTRKLFLDAFPIDEFPISPTMLLALVLSTVILPYILSYLDDQALIAVEEAILADRKKAKMRLRNSIRLSFLGTMGSSTLLRKKLFSSSVESETPLRAGDAVKVIKKGSHKLGKLGKVVSPNWNGLVKVILDGAPLETSYRRIDLELVLAMEESQALGEPQVSRTSEPSTTLGPRSLPGAKQPLTPGATPAATTPTAATPPMPFSLTPHLLLQESAGNSPSLVSENVSAAAAVAAVNNLMNAWDTPAFSNPPRKSTALKELKGDDFIFNKRPSSLPGVPRANLFA